MYGERRARRIRRPGRRPGRPAVVVRPTERVTVLPPTPAIPEVRVTVDTPVPPSASPSPAAGASDCSAWERDRPRFARAVARRYLLDAHRRPLAPEGTWCAPDGKYCDVRFPGGITVRVSFARLPGLVIARRVFSSPPGPRLEYSYQCEAGKLLLRRVR
jgi:hypothetical protein